jgi:SNF2 family DNA or RNA helicase
VFLNDWIFNQSFFGFRNNYFHLARGGQVMQMHGQVITRDLMRDIMRKGWKYEITKENLAKLMGHLEPYVFRARKEECLDLPDQIDEVRRVELSGDQARVYRDMKRDLIAELKGSFVTAPVALTKLIKLREIASGFAIDTQGRTVDIGASAKLTELEQVLEEAGRQQVIIWCNFKWENEKIQELLTSKEKTFSTLYSDTKDKDESIRMFKEGISQYLVANPHSAAHGLTLVNSSMEVFFSLDYSWEYYEQAKARIHRAGQVNKCTYIHIVAKNTIDEQILKVLRSKSDVNQIVEEYLR